MRKTVKILGSGVLTLSLAACAGQADLGRSKPNELSFFSDLGEDVAKLAERADPAAGLPMTAEEAQLRTIARTIKDQLAEHQSDFLQNLLHGFDKPEDDKSYYLALRRIHAASGTSLLNAFGKDVLQDIALVDQFANLSIAVTDSDAMRLNLVREAMELQNAAFSDAVDVVLRVEHNGDVIDEMADLMTERMRHYRIALEQSAFDIPERDLIATIDKALDILDRSVDGIKGDAVRHRSVRGELFGRRSADRPV